MYFQRSFWEMRRLLFVEVFYIRNLILVFFPVCCLYLVVWMKRTGRTFVSRRNTTVTEADIFPVFQSLFLFHHSPVVPQAPSSCLSPAKHSPSSSCQIHFTLKMVPNDHGRICKYCWNVVYFWHGLNLSLGLVWGRTATCITQPWTATMNLVRQALTLGVLPSQKGDHWQVACFPDVWL